LEFVVGEQLQSAYETVKETRKHEVK